MEIKNSKFKLGDKVRRLTNQREGVIDEVVEYSEDERARMDGFSSDDSKPTHYYHIKYSDGEVDEAPEDELVGA